MTPYYVDDLVTIYHADCREWMPAADTLITDPPYGISYRGGGASQIHRKQSRRRVASIAGDSEPFDPSLFLAFRNVALFGAQHYYSRLPEGGTFHVWDKRGDYKPVHTADFDTVWINRKEPGRINRTVWRGICRETEHSERILHPTQKPLRVMAWVLGMFPDAELILDPFMGSGTTLVVAKSLNRRAIGIEIEERYCEIAANRCRQEVLGLSA